MGDPSDFVQLAGDSIGSDISESLTNEEDATVQGSEPIPLSPVAPALRVESSHRVTGIVYFKKKRADYFAVVLRLRPTTAHERDALRVLRKTRRGIPDECLIHDDVKVTVSPHTYPSFFTVDRIFGTDSTNRDIYLACVHHHVNSFVAGHSCM